VLFAVAAILVVTASGREGATDERTANNFASTDPTSAVVSGSGRLLRPGPKPVARKLLQNDLVPFIVNGQPVPRGQKLFMASLRKTWNGASRPTRAALETPGARETRELMEVLCVPACRSTLLRGRSRGPQVCDYRGALS
jgi:hypothetical protein